MEEEWNCLESPFSSTAFLGVAAAAVSAVAAVAGGEKRVSTD